MPTFGWKFRSLLVALLIFSSPTWVDACDGFFCSIFPISQVNEKILFVQGEGAVTTHVQIQ